MAVVPSDVRVLVRALAHVPYVASVVCAVFAGGCADDADSGSPENPNPDGAMFAGEIYPLLLRDCGFPSCHGAPERFFRVVGPGRLRLTPELTKPADPLTLAELFFSYERTRDMLLTSAAPEDSLLLRKPLETSAGGQGHQGSDEFGRNVFASRGDPRYLALMRWANLPGPLPTMNELALAQNSTGALTPAPDPAALGAAGGAAPIGAGSGPLLSDVDGSCTVRAGPGSHASHTGLAGAFGLPLLAAAAVRARSLRRQRRPLNTRARCAA